MNKLKVLVVEDNQDNIKAAKVMLAQHELTVISEYDQAHQLLRVKYDIAETKKKIDKMLPKGWICKLKNGKNTDDVTLIFENNGETFYSWQLPKEISDMYELCHNASVIIPFDIVITDVMLPKGGNACMSYKGQELAKQQGTMPYGPIIALRAIQIGVAKIGIITSGNHHDDPFVYAFDGLYGFSKGDLKVVCTNHCEVDVEKATYKPVDVPNFNAPEYEEYSQRRERKEIIRVKNWTGIFNTLL